MVTQLGLAIMFGVTDNRQLAMIFLVDFIVFSDMGNYVDRKLFDKLVEISKYLIYLHINWMLQLF